MNGLPPASLADLLTPLLPSCVVSRMARFPEIAGDLFPEEARCVERAVEKRRQEFRAGRVLARELLARLGVAPGPILPQEDRRPRWPAGIVGSITHTDGCCGVAVAREADLAGVGVDVEVAGQVRQKLHSHVLREEERAWVAGHGDPARLGTILFSAKEALFKAWYPATREYLGFQDVILTLDLSAGRFAVEFQNGKGLGRTDLAGRFREEGRWVIAALAWAREPTS